MTNKKELLELAAKAAGYEIDHYYDGRQGEFAEGLILRMSHCPNIWNPAQDDGQCLQLARKLGINIDYADCTAWKRSSRFGEKLIQEYWGGECWENDREAVLAVAAEIGRAML